MATGAQDKRALLEEVTAQAGEGVVAKLLAAHYVPGEAAPTLATQRKYKLVDDASCVVTSVHPMRRSVGIGLTLPGD